jgi:hypothetical protein
VLIVASLTILSSCCKPKTEYVERIIHIKPDYPELERIQPTEYPQPGLVVWGDYKRYKALCEAQIDKCNADKSALIEPLKGK